MWTAVQNRRRRVVVVMVDLAADKAHILVIDHRHKCRQGTNLLGPTLGRKGGDLLKPALESLGRVMERPKADGSQPVTFVHGQAFQLHMNPVVQKGVYPGEEWLRGLELLDADELRCRQIDERRYFDRRQRRAGHALGRTRPSPGLVT